MLNTKIWLIGASLILACTANCVGQECYSCEGQGHGFGYPGHGYVDGMHRGRRAHGERWQAWKAESAKISARNDAWMKPFACQDRISYYSVWEPMISQGYAQNCVLGADHFQADTNELNEAGRIKIVGIMQNLPADRRNLLVTRDQNESVSQARLASVHQMVQTYYGATAGNMMVGLTDMVPAKRSGIEAAGHLKRQLETAPAPIIPLVSVGNSVSTSK